VLRAQISFESRHGSDAPPLLLKAAKRLEPLDPRLAREIYLDAVSATLFAYSLASDAGPAVVAEAARAAPGSSQPPRTSDLLLDGLALLVTDGHAAAVPVLRRALSAFRGEETSQAEGLRWGVVAIIASGLIWDYASWDALSSRLVRLARDAGDLSVLPLGLTSLAGVHVFGGETALAAALSDEVTAVTEATGVSFTPYAGLELVAFQGREARASELIQAVRKEVLERGDGSGLSFTYWATAVLNNGLGRYEDALAAARQTMEDSYASWWRNLGLVEMSEAAVRSGETEIAADVLDLLAQTTAPSGTDWALGVEARSRALLSEGEAAEALYREAIERLARTRVRVDLARGHLLYGEWLRRARRRLDAREQLRTAHNLFADFGMEAFAERARVELEATGEHARKRTVQTRDDLTPQEAQISRLAAEGATNQEIAAQLFISPSTVDYHLRKAFRKLDVKSRHQLKQHLPQPSQEAAVTVRDH
jgi:DNA-binding CsgD family transcriptional regulator